jgi:hypothetical protein
VVALPGQRAAGTAPTHLELVHLGGGRDPVDDDAPAGLLAFVDDVKAPERPEEGEERSGAVRRWRRAGRDRREEGGVALCALGQKVLRGASRGAPSRRPSPCRARRPDAGRGWATRARRRAARAHAYGVPLAETRLIVMRVSSREGSVGTGTRPVVGAGASARACGPAAARELRAGAAAAGRRAAGEAKLGRSSAARGARARGAPRPSCSRDILLHLAPICRRVTVFGSKGCAVTEVPVIERIYKHWMLTFDSA